MNITLFLRELADKIENDELNETQLRSVSEFWLAYNFPEDVTVDELSKYAFLGWYIYSLKSNEFS